MLQNILRNAKFLVPLLGAAMLVLAGSTADPARAQAQDVETFTGNLVDLGGTGASTSSRFELHVDRYDGADELARLAALQDEKGVQALQDALWERSAGYIRVDHALGYPVGLAFHLPAEGGRRTIYAVMDRPIQLFEIWRGLRTRDYPFSVAELTVDAQGRGEGKLHAVAKVRISANRLVIENYSPQPFRILDVKPQE
jgi:hypothetical protein